MIFQVFNISDKNIFADFSSSYKIFREIFDGGLFGLEIRDVPVKTAEEIQKIILDEKEICYRKLSGDSADLFIPGSLNQLRNFTRQVISSGKEELGYRLQKAVTNYEEYNNIRYQIAGKEFHFNQAFIMGILNVTPDSFSDGGRYLDVNDAVRHGIEMIDDGADFIDIGGESTRPGSDPVDEEEETGRVIPVIKKILDQRPNALISVDTTKSEVAAKALDSGAVIVNDISGLTFDKDMIETVTRFNATVVIMHIKGVPKNMQQIAEYDSVVKEVYNFLFNQCTAAAKSGIKNIFIDPGIGFGKTSDHNFELLKRLDDFKSLGYPILAGVSRKSFIGKLLDLDITERDPATAIAETGAVLNGARIIRTHNVKYCKYVCKITEKLN